MLNCVLHLPDTNPFVRDAYEQSTHREPQSQTHVTPITGYVLAAFYKFGGEAVTDGGDYEQENLVGAIGNRRAVFCYREEHGAKPGEIEPADCGESLDGNARRSVRICEVHALRGARTKRGERGARQTVRESRTDGAA